MNIFLGCVIFFPGGLSYSSIEKINEQHTQIETLTERVQLLENALSDKSGIKK